MKVDSLLRGGALALAFAFTDQAALGQYAGYTPQPQAYGQQAAPAGPPAYQPGAQPVYGQRAPAPAYTPPAAQPAPGYAAAPGYQPPQAATAPAYQPPAGYNPAAPAPGFGRYAFLQDNTAAGSGSRDLPTPTESVTQPPTAAAPVYTPPAVPAPTPVSQPVAHSHAPATHQGPAPVSWEGYLNTSTAAAPASAGCATGNCGSAAPAAGCATGGCGDFTYSGGGYDTGCYAGDYCDAGPKRQWFAGIYGLYISRDNPPKTTSAFLIDSPPSAVYYPDPARDIFFTTDRADVDFQGGAEVRFGSTFGCATDPCGCSTYQPFAWEVGYWGLAEDYSQSVITDNTIAGTDRIYGAIDYTGIEYDRDGVAGGTFGYRPLNDYFDYQAPVDSGSTNDVRVIAVRTRQSFQVQNLELNFWRFGAPATPAAYGGSACGGGACGSCGGGACGSGSCGVGGGCGYDACGCAPARPPRRFFINGLAGVRYLRIDESFGNDIFFSSTSVATDSTTPPPDNFPTDGPNSNQYIFHDIEVDNDLVGFQLGCSMNCLVGCKWSLFCDTNFGIYGNDIESYQRFRGEGAFRFVGTGGSTDVRASKTDVSFLGEARCGIGYQLSPTCRLTSAYRVIAVTGVALAGQQLNTPINEAALGHIDSNGSIVIHGFQGGVEFKY